MAIPKYKDPITGKWNRITAYGQSGNAVEIIEISGETVLSDDIITELKNDLNWISYGGGAYRFVSSEEDKRLYSYITEDKIRQILVNTLTKTCILRETQITAASVADSIVKRDSYGEIPVSTPSRDLSATNKAYVDEADKTLRLKLSNLEQALNGYILDTTKEAYTDLDSAVLKNSVAVGDNVYPIADKTRALVTRIEGKTTKMVQLLKNGDFSQGTDNWSKFSAAVNNISFEVVDNSLEVTALTGGTGGDNYMVTQQGMQTPAVGHKCLILVTAKIMQSEGITGFSYEGYATFTRLVKIDNANLYYAFITTNKTSNWYGLKPYGTKAVGDKWSFSNCQCFDLTAMNREDITTVEQFKAEFPDIYPYENGNIYPAKISGVKFYEKQDKSGEQASVTLPATYDLHGIGGYKDYLEITKNENNELYTLKKVQVIDKHIFDGTEHWTSYGSSDFTNLAYSTSSLGSKFINWQSRASLMNLFSRIAIPADDEGYAHGDSSATLYIRLPNIATAADMKAHVLSMYEAGTPYIFYGAIATPVETVIATNLTYEQVTAIRHNGGLIEVEGNTNKAYAKPTVKNTVVYRLTATNTAEG